ncbi:SDR family oxidoreductase [Pseudoalteromonas luteoviolacea]|uniref:SDR family NAD(P)-dependent oxidoreductase n=1 Tax=Pseudoalteromonas luteoviolacea TaxID=43657 RepID=UPI001F34F640|nr:SDR family oxidoreductase [Pseudoalteromonas luteoviolacea]MCF6439814.1 SDR family oxidoreductase [Pseudoalteromonas luteoviolacea]
MLEGIKEHAFLVTGASAGIGQATAVLLAKLGAKVTILARRENELLQTLEMIKPYTDDASYLVADINQHNVHHQAIEHMVTKYGRFDGAFNNVGTIGNFAPLLEQSEADFDRTLTTNTKSIWLAVQAQARYFKEQQNGGVIVNTSSWLANGGLIGSTSYSASKGALDAFIRPAALELSQYGIRINNINPGGIDTQMTRKAFNHDETVLQQFANQHPRGCLGSCLDIANTVAFLLSDAAVNITGQSITVDGGYAIAGQR